MSVLKSLKISMILDDSSTIKYNPFCLVLSPADGGRCLFVVFVAKSFLTFKDNLQDDRIEKSNHPIAAAKSFSVST